MHWYHGNPLSSITSSSSSSTPSQNYILSCSADKTCILWDTLTLKKIKKFTGHTGIINTLSPFNFSHTFISGSDDKTIRLWDLRESETNHKRTITSSNAIFTDNYPVLSVVASNNPEDEYTLFSGGIDGIIKQWDIRKPNQGPTLTYVGHQDSITSLTINPSNNNQLMSISYDNTIRIWNTKPYVPNNQRLINIYTGITNNYEMNLLKGNWNYKNTYIGCGSSDRSVYIYNIDNHSLQYKLGGHNGVVTCIAFHPYENIIASGSTDKTICIGVLEEEEIDHANVEEVVDNNTNLPEGITIGEDF